MVSKSAIIGISLGLVVGWSSNTWASNITWRIDQAVAVGSGCNAQNPAPDTWFITAGDDLSIAFTRMRVSLTRPGSGNTAVINCLVRVPVDVEASPSDPLGLLQRLSWGYLKDLGTEADLVTSASLLDLPLSPIEEYLGTGFQGGAPFTQSSTHDWLVQSGDGMFELNLAVAARRQQTSQRIAIGIAGDGMTCEYVVN